MQKLPEAYLRRMQELLGEEYEVLSWQFEK